MNPNEIIFFSAFLLIILAILFFDLGILTKESHTIKLKEALFWTAVWVILAMVFFFILQTHGDLIHGKSDFAGLKELQQKYHHPVKIDGLSFSEAMITYKSNLALEYLTGYLIEYSLSVDNVFVILLILTSFSVQHRYYKRILFWGILGAIVMRFLFIFLSSALIQKFSWILLVFGAFLVVTGIQMYLKRNKVARIDPVKHPVVRFTSRYLRVSRVYTGDRFLIREEGRWLITPLFIVLLIIEFSDVIFAVDSVPAIFAVTKDPYIVFFSNIFAILGLRSMFFVLASIINRFSYIKEGLSALLIFIGIKMLFHKHFENWGFTTTDSLLVILTILVISILASVLFPKERRGQR